MEQQFSLSWNDFQVNLSKGFSELLGNQEFVDVSFAVEGQLLTAHQTILSICSPYFKEMFRTNPCKHPIVILKGITYTSMQQLLEFVYNGAVSINEEDLSTFVNTAELLEIKGLSSKNGLLSEKESISKKGTVKLKCKKTSDLTKENHDSCLPDYHIPNPTTIKRKPEDFMSNNHYDKRMRISNSVYNENSFDINHQTDITSNNKDNNAATFCADSDIIKKENESVQRIDTALCDKFFSNGLQPPNHATSEGSQRLCYILSKKGHKQIIHENFIFTKHSENHGKTSWRCVQYFSVYRCPVTMDTADSKIVHLNHHHNHGDHYDKICNAKVYKIPDSGVS